MAPYRVLSIDGGGIRGIITVLLLEKLSKAPGLRGWLDKVDLIAGTSTGGLLALGLARGVPLKTIRELYETKGRKIFDDSFLHDLVDLGKIIGADYEIKGLMSELKKVLGDVTLARLQKKVLVTAFDLDNSDDPNRPASSPRTWKPKLFHNFPGKSSDGNLPAWKVGLYTAAAPTYFPSVDGYVDGGVYASNPSMCALAQTQDDRYGPPASLRDVRLLSLGTGTNLQYIKGQSIDWGYAQWAKPLISLMLDGVSGIADYQCRQILGERYHRLAPVFPEGQKVDMDDVSRVPYMERFASGLQLDETIDWIARTWI